MHYIVVDFEWNQPLSYNSISFRQIEDKLLFEIIEIGAVKLDSAFNILGTFKQIIKPQYFTKLHPRIKRITNLCNNDLEGNPDFVTANKLFQDFCGEDPYFITWGSEDVSVYKQNLDCFNVEHNELKFFNLQRMFSQKYINSKQQAGLKPAMDALDIVEDENMPFHDALSDAYYTAKILQSIENKDQILNYPQFPKKLVHNAKFDGSTSRHQVLSVKHALNSQLLRQPECPACRRRCTLQSDIVPQSPTSYIAFAKCDIHGALFMQAKFGLLSNKNVGLNLKLTPATKDHKRYLKTKELQNKTFPDMNKLNGALPSLFKLESFPFDE